MCLVSARSARAAMSGRVPAVCSAPYCLPGSFLTAASPVSTDSGHHSNALQQAAVQAARIALIPRADRQRPGKDMEATAALESLLQRYPYRVPSCEALGELLMTAKRYDEAQGTLRKAVRQNPKSVKANNQLGLVLAHMGKKEESDRQLELAKSLRQEDQATSRLQLRLLDPDK
jgi:Flp pilus assembly protein TadD